MLLMGDEMRNSQGGNNNAYCQDNEISWLDWRLLEKHRDVHRFVKMLIAQRLNRHSRFSDDDQRESLNELIRQAQIQFHGVKLSQPDMGHDSHSLALGGRSWDGKLQFHVMLNSYWGALEFELPPGVDWRLWLDTYRESPDDIHAWDRAPDVPDTTYVVQPRSIVALVAQV
jgi:glycogen operon protein